MLQQVAVSLQRLKNIRTLQKTAKPKDVVVLTTILALSNILGDAIQNEERQTALPAKLQDFQDLFSKDSAAGLLLH
jgi:hypothetical protein